MEDACSAAFEQILDQSGHFGFFQKRIYFLTCLLQAVCASILGYTMFSLDTSPVSRLQSTADRDLSYVDFPGNLTNNVSLLLESSAEQKNFLQKLDVRCMELSSSDNSYYTVTATGALIGALLGAFLADLLGRRILMFLSFGLVLIVHALMMAARSCLAFIGLRFTTGIFSGCFIIISIVLPLEFVGQNWRDLCVCLGFWTLGLPLLSLEAYLAHNWRYLALTSSAVGIPFVGTFFLIPESARWLTCNQRFRLAETILKEMISCNTKPVHNITALCDTSRFYVTNTTHPRRHNYLDLFHSFLIAKWTSCILYSWCVASVVYMSLLHKISNLTGNKYVDLFLPFIMDVPVCLSAVVVNKCIGRRWCLFLYAFSAGFGLFCVLVLHVTGDIQRYPQMAKGLAAFGKMGVGTACAFLCLMTAETYPTVIRCMGCAAGFSAGIVGTLLSQHIGFLESCHYTVPYIVHGLLISTVGIAGLQLPETTTSCSPLPDILPCRHKNDKMQSEASIKLIQHLS